MGRGLRRWAAVGLLAPVVLAGCSGGGETDQVARDVARGEDRAGAPAPDTGDGMAADEATEAAGGGEAEDDGDTTITVGAETAGRDVIRRADLTLASDDPERTVDDIGAAADAAGGFVSGTELYREGGVLAGSVTVRVPASELDATLTRIEAAGTEVRSRTLSSEDVTDKLTDIEAQLRNLRALETQLLELLADARDSGDTEEVLNVFDRIRQTRDEIERLEGRQQNLEELVALATITVRIEPTATLLAQTAPERDPEPGPWSPARQVEVAWDTTVRALQSVVDVGIVVAVTVLPVVLVVLLPAAVLLLLLRAVRRRRTGGTGGPTPPVDRPDAPTGDAARAPVPSGAGPERD